MTTAVPSEACCKRPPVTLDYTPQGRYETLAGVKTYVTGPSTATKAIIDVYDIFGYRNQTLQGADLLAALTGALVLVPDFFGTDGADEAWFPPDTPEKKAALGTFFAQKADYAKNTAVLLAVRKALAAAYPAVDAHVGVFGLCWGGKIAVLAAAGPGNNEDEGAGAGAGRRFTATGAAHPGGLDAADAEAVTVPYLLLASPGEDPAVVQAIAAILARPDKTGEVETYSTMFHGWMGARSKLDDPANRAEYIRGYEQAAAFYNKYL